jgi:hypothetical protein
MIFSNMQMGWIDFSKKERGDVTTILRLLGTPSALDEIGIGTIRDGFSNLLFPGLSTQQTRAKYFVLIPYLFSLAEKQRLVRRSDVGAWIHRQEDALVKTLIENSGSGELGIIGTRNLKQRKPLVRKPSDIYWTGLRAASILRWPDLSFEDVCSILYARQQDKKGIHLKAESDDAASDDKDAVNGEQVLFTPIKAGYDLFSSASIDLTYPEAAYLKERFVDSEKMKNSLMAYLLKHPDAVCNQFEEIDTRPMQRELAAITELAKDFSSFIYGAHLLYNIIFSDDQDKGMIRDFEAWKEEEYHSIDLDSVISVTGCSASAGAFIHQFDSYISKGDISSARECIRQRETVMKRDRAKLGHSDQYQPVHTYRLDYRYSVGTRIISDIFSGLEGYHGSQTI